MRENEIRPRAIFDKYLTLSAEDAHNCFVGERLSTRCVGCESDEADFAFKKHGFDYQSCLECGTLFLSPRPTIDQFERFYSDSPSSEFWAKEFFPSVMERRKDLIFVPRVEKISSLLAAHRIEPKVVMDVGAGYGLFLQEWKKKHPNCRAMAIEPSKDLAGVCREKGFEVLETIVEKAQPWHGLADLVVCFEVIEHAHNPLTLVKALRTLLAPGGTLLLSGLGVDGFDIQLLWENSKSVSPPHHINFLSVRGYEQLFRRAGFTDVTVSTPGQLDFDIVRGTDPELLSPAIERFMKTMVLRGEPTMQRFQEFLKENCLSSHTWVMAR